MPEKSTFQRDMELLADFPAKPIPDKKAYVRIGDHLTAPDVLIDILGHLIDDYTVARLDQGELIDEDLLRFKQWVKETYANE